MVQHIEYDLIRPGQDYEELIAAIKALGDWARPTKSSWLVQTNLSTAALHDELWRHMDANDRLLVLPVVGGAWASGGLPAEITDWIKAHL